MKVLLYLFVPVMVVAAFSIVAWIRNRQPTSLESGVDAFRREMQALSPDAAPLRRRPGLDQEVGREPHADDAFRPRGPRRPGGPGREGGPGGPGGLGRSPGSED